MISPEDVKKLASLARIRLSPEEEESLAKDMENILGYVDQIQNISLSSAQDPKAGKESAEKNSEQKERVRNVLREDGNAYEPGIFTEYLLSAAPKREGQYVKVKKIL